jgi:hypothetical protein
MSLTSILCRHVWYWSERHGSDRCRRCGKLAEARPVAAPVAAPKAQPAPAAGVTTLTERLDLLAGGGTLSREQMLQTVVDLIEDAQTARPQLSADLAARYCAVLARDGRPPA